MRFGEAAVCSGLAEQVATVSAGVRCVGRWRKYGVNRLSVVVIVYYRRDVEPAPQAADEHSRFDLAAQAGPQHAAC
jgi:hypothetical protein